MLALLTASIVAMSVHPSPALAKGTVRVVPSDYATIQAAVTAARPGDTVLIKPGVYKEGVSVTTDGITIRGVDRFRTVLDGAGSLSNGFIVDGADNVTVSNLTVREYTSNGVYFTHSDGYRMSGIDAIKNGVYGLYAFHSYKGVIENSFAWGHGDAGLYIGECLECEAVVRNVHAEWNLLGYSGTNATGVEIYDSTWVNNSVGIVPNSLPLEGEDPNRGGLIHDNFIAGNNNAAVPPASIWTTYGAPTGTGIWLFGVNGNIVKENRILDHDRYGVLISISTDSNLPQGNEIADNFIRDSGMYDLAWDGFGAGNCFAGNDFTGATAPPMVETIYTCDAPAPLPGILFPPVIADFVTTFAQGSNPDSGEIPEPKRPSCQKGRRGCRA